MDTSIKEENTESVNIYFFRKIKKGKKMEFIGFNYEKLNIFQSDLKTMEFENNRISLFEKLENQGKLFLLLKVNHFFQKIMEYL